MFYNTHTSHAPTTNREQDRVWIYFPFVNLGSEKRDAYLQILLIHEDIFAVTLYFKVT